MNKNTKLRLRWDWEANILQDIKFFICIHLKFILLVIKEQSLFHDPSALFKVKELRTGNAMRDALWLGPLLSDSTIFIFILKEFEKFKYFSGSAHIFIALEMESPREIIMIYEQNCHPFCGIHSVSNKDNQKFSFALKLLYAFLKFSVFYWQFMVSRKVFG